MAIENQGYIRNLNLIETTNQSLAIANLAGVTIPEDLKIIQNNLRNTSTIGYSTFSNGFFVFSDLEYIFTDDDQVKISQNVSIGSTTLNTNITYFICNSDGKNKFKISTTSSSVGINTFDVISVSNTNFSFIRDDSVSLSNLENIIDTSLSSLSDSTSNELRTVPNRFLYESTFGKEEEKLKNGFEFTQNNIEFADFLTIKKYTASKDINTNDILKYEGVLKFEDPVAFNSNTTNLSNQKSPGVFIGDIRAFSSDSNPWSEESSALKTFSSAVSINELFFYDQLQITGINTFSSSPTNPNTFTHKLPIKVDGELYYLLLRESDA